MTLFLHSLYSKPLYLRLILTLIVLPITIPLALLTLPIFIYQFYKLTHTNKEL